MHPSTSIQNKKNIAPYAKSASLEIKALMARTETRYDDLSSKLKLQGVDISTSNLRNKISGNTLSAGLFLMIMHVLSNNHEITITVNK